ncbi:MAG TPA: iron-containing alcohol dehydrogenase [Pirellulales bacterium]|nr:iron-containing alcohol dehydrogenase [Pirellulales bacterium]
MRTTWTFHSAAKLVFGSGATGELGDLAGELGLRRVMIVTDRTLVGAGIVDTVRDPLAGRGISLEVFDGGQPEPSIDLAEACIAAARAFKPDGLLGLGGGSNMDLAKIVATVLAHGGSVRDYLGDGRIPGPVLPLVCVPTTSGTGSEVTAASVLTDTANAMKVGVLSNYLRPAIAVVDPKLTLSCPRKVTADSGIDALTHAIEGYTAIDNADFPLPPGERSVYQGRHPLGDCLAERAIALVGQHLVRAVEQPKNLEAREGMSLAATIAGLAFSNVGVALVHAMEYPLGGATHCSHGAGNGLLLPFVMRFNLPGREREMARVAELLGEDVRGLSTAAAAERAITAVERLKLAIGIPERMRDLGVRQDQIAGFAEKAFAVKRILRVNPRPVTCAEIEGVYAAAL